MKKKNILNSPISLFKLMLVAVIGFTSITTSASEEHKDEIVSMSVEMAKQNSIETVAATSGVIHNEEVVYGKIVADPASLAHVNARFDGVIKEVKVNLGEEVKKR